jgi:DinB superfamily
MNDLKYPVGSFTDPGTASAGEVQQWIRTLEEFPAMLRSTVGSMNDNQLDTRYREGGWSVRQVVHHLADSHMNAYIRFKLALTERNPTIKPYLEDRWGELKEARQAPVEISLQILEALHRRWVLSLRNMTTEEWERTYYHPESGKEWKLSSVLALYAWHCRHHHAHITNLAMRLGWVQ